MDFVGAMPKSGGRRQAAPALTRCPSKKKAPPDGSGGACVSVSQGADELFEFRV